MAADSDGPGRGVECVGIAQLADFVTQSHESLTMKGTSAQAADLYGLPLWMKVAFALGSIGGLRGHVRFGGNGTNLLTRAWYA